MSIFCFCQRYISLILLCSLLQHCKTNVNTAMTEEQFAPMLEGTAYQASSNMLATQTGGNILELTASAASGYTTQLTTSVFTAFSGERISFRKEEALWQAIIQSGFRASMGKRILPVVSQEDVASSLAALQHQDRLLSRSRIHIMSTAQPPYTSCVYIGKLGLMGGAPDEDVVALRAQLNRERLARKKLENEQKTLRMAYEQQLYSMETEKAERESAYEKLSNAYTTLQVRMHEKNQPRAVRSDSEDREREKYKTKYKQLLDKHKTLQARVCEADRLYKALQSSSERERKMCRGAYDQLSTAHAELQSNMEAMVYRHMGITQSRWCLAGVVLGKEAWDYYIGDVGEEPALPADLFSILNGSCPFSPNKKVRDTHLLVLIPAKVNGRSFTLDSLNKFANSPRNGNRSLGYYNYNSPVKSALGVQSHYRSYWVLMSRCVLPGSSYKLYNNQKVLFSDHANRLNYVLPGTLEAATVILLHHLSTGEFLYPEDSLIYTLCRDSTMSNDRVIVGGFSPAGLNIVEFGFANKFFNFNIGISGLRRL